MDAVSPAAGVAGGGLQVRRDGGGGGPGRQPLTEPHDQPLLRTAQDRGRQGRYVSPFPRVEGIRDGMPDVETLL